MLAPTNEYAKSYSIHTALWRDELLHRPGAYILVSV
jgi:hypothetical protein